MVVAAISVTAVNVFLLTVIGVMILVMAIQIMARHKNGAHTQAFGAVGVVLVVAVLAAFAANVGELAGDGHTLLQMFNL